MDYTLGLDIGIASVGWAVLRNDDTGEPFRIENLGVRTFEKAEQPKTGGSPALPRRETRSARRRLRRKRHRKERIKQLITESGLMSADDMEAIFSNSAFYQDVYSLRAEGLDRLLNNTEWVRVLIHLAQRRGYRSNSTSETCREADAGALKEAVSANRRLLSEKGYRTVGEMFCLDQKFQSVGPDGKVWRTTRNTAGDYRFTVTRDMIAAETTALFSAQRFFGSHSASRSFEKQYTNILFSQRNYDEGPGGNSRYQQNDPRGYCSLEPEERCAFKACYSFEYFKLLQDLNHIHILQDGTIHPLTADQRKILNSLALTSETLTYAKIRKALNLPKEASFSAVRCDFTSLDAAEDKFKFSEMQSYHRIRKALAEIDSSLIVSLSPEKLDTVCTILGLYRTDDKRRSALAEIGLSSEVIRALLPLSFSKVSCLSLKALRKLTPLLEQGILYNDACTAVYGSCQHHPDTPHQRTITLNPEFLKNGALDGITNPAALRAISQSLKILNSVIRKYGSPQRISYEFSHEIYKNLDERRKYDRRRIENEKQNRSLMDHIAKIKGKPADGLDLVKWKLWQDQGGICLYSGQPISSEHLFESGYADADHIIPYSISFDDSYNNKVLVLASENRRKGNLLPQQYMSGQPDQLEHYISRVESTVLDFRKRQRLLKKTLTAEEISGFKNRSLKSSQYISRTVYSLLKDHLAFAPSKHIQSRVLAVNSTLTDYMQKRTGLYRYRKMGDLYHAINAAVIASADEKMLYRISLYSKWHELGGNSFPLQADQSPVPYTASSYNEFPEPWPKFRQELLDRLSSNPYETIMAHQIPNYSRDEIIRPIFISRMPRRKVTGAAHEETIRSAKASGCSISKTPLSSLKLDKYGEIKNYFHPSDDLLLYEALKHRLHLFAGDASKAFSEPFYKPKKDGTQGPLVKTVKLCEKSTLNVKSCSGIAKNGSMIRIDIFFAEGAGYYFVPIYTADTAAPALPKKAAAAGKAYQDWPEMQNEDFIFSLYPGDPIHIVSSEPVSLQSCDKAEHGTSEIKQCEWTVYFVKASISTASIAVETHDRKYSKASLGIKRLVQFDKLAVDPLGQIFHVHIPEKRQKFQ